MDHSLLNEIAFCIIGAWLMGLAARWLKQPLILAYLLTGVIVGPIGIGLVKDQHSIETISGLGLILLLFIIGLEIDLKKMLSAGRAITITAATQILGGCALGVLFFKAIGFDLTSKQLDALYLAVSAAMSSTVIIVKILYDKHELDTLAGRLTLGMLVLQDLFAILFLALQPNLKDPAVDLLFISFGKVLVLVIGAFVASRYILPIVFRSVSRLPELVQVGALAWCFLMAGLAHYFGLSREMGALIAGVSLSTFPYTLDVAAKITSIRDFFVTLFFVALGMTIPAPNVSYISSALYVSLFVISSRFLTVFPPLYRMRQGHRVSLIPAINLSQMSELSLVILAIGFKLGHVQKETIGIAAYAFVILAIFSTYTMARTDSILRWTSPLLKRFGMPDLEHHNPEPPTRAPRIFFLGFSFTASSLLEEITRKEPSLLEELAVIDFNPHVNEELRARGIRIIYGDISHRHTLEHAGVAKADILVCTIPNSILKGTNQLKLTRELRELNATAQIIMHTETFADLPKLYEAGANYVSLPRLVEAIELYSVLHAAHLNLLNEKRSEIDQELIDRKEVIA